jgi:hypothetical protein
MMLWFMALRLIKPYTRWRREMLDYMIPRKARRMFMVMILWLMMMMLFCVVMPVFFVMNGWTMKIRHILLCVILRVFWLCHDLGFRLIHRCNPNIMLLTTRLVPHVCE